MLSYRSVQHNSLWHCRLYAANLVPSVGTSKLPPLRGNFEVVEMDSHGSTHPLQEAFPMLKVLHYGIIMDEAFLVYRDGVEGIALFLDFNGSDPSTSNVSVEGRSITAPLTWENAVATPDLWVTHDGGIYQNHLLHGWRGFSNENLGKDWIDGVPVSGVTMHDPDLGRVAQWIIVPKAQGIGLAQQSIARGYVTEAVSFLVRFPRNNIARELAKLSKHTYGYRGGEESLAFYAPKGATRGGEEKISFSDSDSETSYSIAIGGEIRQHVIENPFSYAVWDKPEILIVCQFIDKQQVKKSKIRHF